MPALLLIFIYVSCICSGLILHHEITWLDDFSYDPMGQTGWNIRQISGYPIPISNPTVIISNKPKYHGPFPPSYAMERYITCNATHNARLFISFLPSYCNTDRKGDDILFTILDPSNTFTMPTFPKYKLNNQQQLFDRNDLPFIQSATATYYTNHSSSSTVIPSCTVSKATDTNEWYTPTIYRSYQVTISGNHEYKIMIEMLLSDHTDEYVAISNIASLCVEIPTTNPTISPSMPSIPSTKYTTNIPDIYSSTHTTRENTLPSTIKPTKNHNYPPLIIDNMKPTLNPSEIEHEYEIYELETHTLSTMIIVDTNISNGNRNLNVIQQLKSVNILLYFIQIISIILCCCLCACVSCGTSIYIKKQIKVLNAVKASKHYRNNHAVLRDIELGELIPQLQLVPTTSCPFRPGDGDEEDSEIQSIELTKSHDSNAASMDVNNNCDGMSEGNPQEINNDSFRVVNKIIDCDSIEEDNQYQFNDNDNACSELHDMEDDEGNGFIMNDDAGSEMAENNVVVPNTNATR